MKKSTVQAVLAAVIVSAAARASLHAQQDFSKVEIKATKIAANFYTLEGQGGVIGVLPGPDGVLMVDSQFAPLTDKIVAAIKQISDRPIRFMINTHVHPDHTGGNENLGKMGVTIIAREQLRARLVKPAAAAGATPAPAAPPAALPMLTFDSPLTLHMNGEDVQLIPIPVAHTDGDTLVKFPAADVIMTGDFYRSLGYPNIDRVNGGSLAGMLTGLDTIVKLAGPNTKIVPGHGLIVDRTAVAEHRAMIIAIRDRVAGMAQKKMTLEQAIAAKPTADYDAKVPGVGTTGDRFIGQLYAEVTATSAR